MAEESYFREPAWLGRHGDIVPDADGQFMSLALEYFSSSPMYDTQCLNEQQKNQNIMPDLARKQLNDGSAGWGMWYDVDPQFAAQAPRLYVLRQLASGRADDRRLLAVYYVYEGTVYQAPTLDAVVGARLASCVAYVRSAALELAQHAACDPAQGFSTGWDGAESGAAAGGAPNGRVEQMALQALSQLDNGTPW